VVLQLVVRQPLAVSLLVVEADERFLGHAGEHAVTDLLAVDVAEHLVLEPANRLGGRASAPGLAAPGFSLVTARLAERPAALVKILASFAGERLRLFS